MYPSISQSKFLTDQLVELPCLILKGRQGKILETVAMPAIDINAIDLSNLINYLSYKWADHEGITIDEISKLAQACRER